MVQRALKENGLSYEVTTVSGAILNTIADDPAAKQHVRSGTYEVIVLQGAQMSSSHKYRYSQAKGTDLARVAHLQKARIIYFSEWPRRGWDETEFILGHYREIASHAPGEIVAVGRGYDRALTELPKLQLWMSDGNHASLAGAFLASQMLARVIGKIDKPKDTFTPSGIDQKTAGSLRKIAYSVEAEG